MVMIILWLFFQDPSKFDWALEEEAGVALNWLKQNQMIANLEKFHAVCIRKDQTNLSREYLNIKCEPIEMGDMVKLQGIYLDYKLNFEKHL